MKIIPFRSRRFEPPKDAVADELFALITHELCDGDLVGVSSKVVAIHQGRCLPLDSIDKAQLIRSEADYLIPAHQNRWGVTVTVRDSCLVGSAGVDESNADRFYVLSPEAPSQWAQRICCELRERSGCKEVGVIVSDSHSTPLRIGVVGVGIGYAGFHPLRDYRGHEDLFGRTLKISQLNILDSVAAAANIVMGEGSEQTPFCIVRDVGQVTFCEPQATPYDIFVEPENDLYHELFSRFEAGGRKRK